MPRFKVVQLSWTVLVHQLSEAHSLEDWSRTVRNVAEFDKRRNEVTICVSLRMVLSVFRDLLDKRMEIEERKDGQVKVLTPRFD